MVFYYETNLTVSDRYLGNMSVLYKDISENRAEDGNHEKFQPV
jgi:hypothetical protein